MNKIIDERQKKSDEHWIRRIFKPGVIPGIMLAEIFLIVEVIRLTRYAISTHDQSICTVLGFSLNILPSCTLAPIIWGVIGIVPTALLGAFIGRVTYLERSWTKDWYTSGTAWNRWANRVGLFLIIFSIGILIIYFSK